MVTRAKERLRFITGDADPPLLAEAVAKGLVVVDDEVAEVTFTQDEEEPL